MEYKITGGGFYVGVINTRTKKYSWVRKSKLDTLKKTERWQMSLEEAKELEARNNANYMKMANVKVEKIQ